MTIHKRSHLAHLESEAIFIMREVAAEADDFIALPTL